MDRNRQVLLKYLGIYHVEARESLVDRNCPPRLKSVCGISRGSREPCGSKYLTIITGSSSHYVEARESLVDRNRELFANDPTYKVEARESLVDRNRFCGSVVNILSVEARESLVDRNSSYHFW